VISVIVGVGPGMGMSLARRFAPEGPVALVVRRAESGQRYVDELAAAGHVASAYLADIGDEASVRAAFGEIRGTLGDPDLVVFNASVGAPGTPEAVATSDLREAFEVGTLGAVISFQEVAPAMRERGSGTFLVTGSGVALNPWPGGTAITLAKSALRAFVLAAARDLKGSGVHVATVTIDGVLGGPGFEPDTVSERFWELAHQPRDAWTTEIVHRG
jgi:NAD(P)-dependent dehydrogenase (short-subunit alcohol dehydrogenase family)